MINGHKLFVTVIGVVGSTAIGVGINSWMVGWGAFILFMTLCIHISEECN